ncbi:hypothetical protein [Pararhizobium haloflavum]|uniref:hypothetical protein n=1 Tax=Pararhizobium haloflavum TaxID=2037914 RepID=UPI000C19686A|nr:hypothetical protein [Pararhizobium haloflavum]
MSQTVIALLLILTCELILATPLLERLRSTRKLVGLIIAALGDRQLNDEYKERRMLTYSRMLFLLNLFILSLLALYASPWVLAALALPDVGILIRDPGMALALCLGSIAYLVARKRIWQ